MRDCPPGLGTGVLLPEWRRPAAAGVGTNTKQAPRRTNPWGLVVCQSGSGSLPARYIGAETCWRLAHVARPPYISPEACLFSSWGWLNSSSWGVDAASWSSGSAAVSWSIAAAAGEQARPSSDASSQVAQTTQQVQRRTAARISGATTIGRVSTAGRSRSSDGAVATARWSGSDRSVGATGWSSRSGATGVATHGATAIEQVRPRERTPVDLESEIDQARTCAGVAAVSSHRCIAATTWAGCRCFAARRCTAATTHAQHTVQQIAGECLATQGQRSSHHKQS